MDGTPPSPRGKAVVTGAGGFIGGAVAKRLAEGGAEVVGVEVAAGAEERVARTGAEPVRADVTDRDAMREALRGADFLIHTAAIVSDAGSMADHVRVNAAGTAATLDAARDAGVGRALHLSSVVVYGFTDPATQDESAHLRTYGIPYIDTKSASDRLARRRGAVVVRPGDVYGPGSVPWSIRPLELAKAGQLAVPAGGDRRMLAVYIDDLVSGILTALQNGEPGEAYTAWKDDEDITFEEHFNTFAAMCGGRESRHLPRALIKAGGFAGEAFARLTGRPAPMTRHSVELIDRQGSVSAAKLRGIGWRPEVPHAEGTSRTEAWFRSEGLL